MQPDLGIAAIITTATLAAVAGIKKACPKLAGGLTAIVAFGVALVGVLLAYLPRGITAENSCEIYLTLIVAWAGSLGVAWAVRNPRRGAGEPEPPTNDSAGI